MAIYCNLICLLKIKTNDIEYITGDIGIGYLLSSEVSMLEDN